MSTFTGVNSLGSVFLSNWPLLVLEAVFGPVSAVFTGLLNPVLLPTCTAPVLVPIHNFYIPHDQKWACLVENFLSHLTELLPDGKGGALLLIFGTVVILLSVRFQVSWVTCSSCVLFIAVCEPLSKLFWQHPSMLFTLV